jgi:hypothetical protein
MLTVTVLCLCLPLARGYAQPASAASGGSTKARYDAAKKLADQGRYQEAIPLLNDLLTVEPNPRTRNLLAACLTNVGRLGSAYSQFVQSVRECQLRGSGIDAAQRQSAKKYAEDSLQRLLPSLSWVRLRLPQQTPAGLQIRIGDEEIPRSRWSDEVPVDAGNVRILAEAPGVQRVERSLSIAQGEHKEVELAFKNDGAGVLSMQPPTVEGAVVRIDGREIESEALNQPHYLPPGRHRVEAEAPGFRTFVWTGNVDDGVEQRLSLMLRPQATTPRWICYSALGGGLAALIVGATVGGIAQAKANQAALTNDETSRIDVIRLSTAATTFLAIGGTLLAATIPLGLTSDFLRGSARPSKKPLISLAPTSLRALWRF